MKSKAEREQIISNFILEIKKKYHYITIQQEYDDSYMLCHNYRNYLEEEFMLFKHDLMVKHFFNNDLYNIGFSYSMHVKDSNITFDNIVKHA